jgi:glycosyltransferase involved in cell wall biosynthesis
MLQAPIPAGLDVTIFIIDNNTKDDTESVVLEIQSNSTRPLVYIKETKQGLSHARNAGICAGTGDIIGIIDDDEEIHEDWFKVIMREFADQATDFIGGPFLPNWSAPAPAWLPPGYHGVIGASPASPQTQVVCEGSAYP